MSDGQTQVAESIRDDNRYPEQWAERLADRMQKHATALLAHVGRVHNAELQRIEGAVNLTEGILWHVEERTMGVEHG